MVAFGDSAGGDEACQEMGALDKKQSGEPSSFKHHFLLSRC